MTYVAIVIIFGRIVAIGNLQYAEVYLFVIDTLDVLHFENELKRCPCVAEGTRCSTLKIAFWPKIYINSNTVFYTKSKPLNVVQQNSYTCILIKYIIQYNYGSRTWMNFKRKYETTKSCQHYYYHCYYHRQRGSD